jgi:hypothetical protein
MRYFVPNRRATAITLRAPGPRGHTKVAVSFPVRKRGVEIPETAGKLFAAHVAELVAVGVLVVPAAPEPELKPVPRKPVKKDGASDKG